MNAQLYFIILLLLTYFYFSYKKAITAHLDIDLWPHLWCLKAIFIIMCLGIARQVKILKNCFYMWLHSTVQGNVPLSPYFSWYVLLFTSFVLLTVTECYLISMICVFPIEFLHMFITAFYFFSMLSFLSFGRRILFWWRQRTNESISSSSSPLVQILTAPAFSLLHLLSYTYYIFKKIVEKR